jgi:predicted nucleic acid-binding protein
MAAVARYLADTSALARLRHPGVAAVLAPLIESGMVATCGVIAAVAERERVTVLHYDGGYELIAQVTGQPVQWVVPRGTVP